MTKNDNKRERIMAAAARVFSQKSYSQVKIQEIADAAGIGKGTIYEYFTSKETLFGKMIQQGMEQYQQATSLEKPGEISLRQKLHALLWAHIDFCWNHQDMGRLILKSEHPFHGNVADWIVQCHKATFSQLEEAFIHAMQRGEIRNINPRIAARFFKGLVSEVSTDILLFAGSKPKEKDIEETLTFFWSCLSGQGPPG